MTTVENTMAEQGRRTWQITSADKGLGLSTAGTALEQGDLVAVTVLAAYGRHALAEAYPDRFLAFHLGARLQEGIDEVVAQVEKAFDGLNVLVNNTRYLVMSIAAETPPERYRLMFEVTFYQYGRNVPCHSTRNGQSAKRAYH